MARNYAPDYRCTECGKPATLVDIYEAKVLCDEHGKGESEGGLLPLVNSPRVGQCGYCGPCDKSLRFEERAPQAQQAG